MILETPESALSIFTPNRSVKKDEVQKKLKKKLELMPPFNVDPHSDRRGFNSLMPTSNKNTQSLNTASVQ